VPGTGSAEYRPEYWMSAIAIRDQTGAHVGDVDSIGNAVSLAESPRYASPGATVMFRGVAFLE
jgi:hypothetical protein